MKCTLFLRHNKGGDVQVSTKNNDFLFHSQCAAHGRDPQK